MEQLLRENIKFTEERQHRKKEIRKEYQKKYMGFVPLSKTPSPPVSGNCKNLDPKLAQRRTQQKYKLIRRRGSSNPLEFGLVEEFQEYVR